MSGFGCLDTNVVGKSIILLTPILEVVALAGIIVSHIVLELDPMGTMHYIASLLGVTDHILFHGDVGLQSRGARFDSLQSLTFADTASLIFGEASKG